MIPAACQQHPSRRIGVDARIEVVVIDRQYQLDVNRHGFLNNVGAMAGRTPAQQEQHTRDQIAALKKRAMEKKRDLTGKKDDFRVVGAISSAELFSLKRQFGDSVVKNPKELAQSRGLWWGD